jgi:hypothetical protein
MTSSTVTVMVRYALCISAERKVAKHATGLHPRPLHPRTGCDCLHFRRPSAVEGTKYCAATMPETPLSWPDLGVLPTGDMNFDSAAASQSYHWKLEPMCITSFGSLDMNALPEMQYAPTNGHFNSGDRINGFDGPFSAGALSPCRYFAAQHMRSCQLTYVRKPTQPHQSCMRATSQAATAPSATRRISVATISRTRKVADTSAHTRTVRSQ